MLLSTLDFELARRSVDLSAAKSDFASSVAQAFKVMAIMNANQQAFAELIAKSTEVIEDSQALLQEINGNRNPLGVI